MGGDGSWVIDGKDMTWDDTWAATVIMEVMGVMGGDGVVGCVRRY